MKHSRSGLFLMELMFAILFFSLSSTVCIQLFVRAHLTAAQSSDTSRAVVLAQSLAEAFYSDLSSDTLNGKVESLAHNLLPEEPVRGNISGDPCLSLFLDEDWNVPANPGCSQETFTGRYTAVVRLTEDPSFYYAAVTISDQEKGTSLYTLSLKQHRPERRLR